MPFQSEHGIIRWKLHFASSREIVYDALATDSGRAAYWAESAPEQNDVITFHILGYEPYPGKILQREKPSIFALEYFGTKVIFELDDDGANGTDLLLTATQVNESVRMEMVAGWVSVLMAMKAAVDYGIDLRNHCIKRSWNEGFVDY